MRSVVFLYTQASVTKLKGKMVGLNGLEPSTSRLSGGRSNLLSYKPVFLVTPLHCTYLSRYPAGLLLQTCCGCSPLKYYSLYLKALLRSLILARVLSLMRSQHSILLIGCRASRLVEIIGIEPMTPCLQSRCSPS